MHPRMSSRAASRAAIFTWLSACLAVFLAVFLAGGSAHAVVTASWTVESYKDFDKGEAEGAFITSLGEVRPGWDSERTDLTMGGVWSSVKADDGTLFVGTDDEGAIYRIGKKKVDKLTAIESAVAIVSMVRSADGTLYAGTMPAGEIWRVDEQTGKASKLVTLGEAETVWTLALDQAGKTLYAGTGPEGKLFSVNPKTGQASVVFETEDKRITALLVAGDGSVWLGTSEKAQVFRYDPADGRARAIADFAGNEISALADAGESIIASVNDFDEPITSGVKTKATVLEAEKKDKDEGEKPKMPKTGEKPGADERPKESAEPKRKRARKGKGALYRLHGDGRSEQLHALTATYFTEIAVAPSGQIFAGAGDKGRIYLIDTDESVSTAIDVDERIIAVLHLLEGGGLSFVTSDAAAVYRTTGVAKQASYTSDVFDTDVPSRFGKIVWHGRGDVKIETRTGNTAEPGIGWSRFQAPRNIKPGGGASKNARVVSPSGRYVQFRVTFTGDSALQRARVYYLPYNRPTEIESIEVKPLSEDKGVTLASGAIDPRSPIMKLSWKVENPDEDKTRYRLEVRREGDALWRPIAVEKKPLLTTKYSWNTETFPDGYYRLRVTAIDDHANSSDRARISHKTTPLFLVDNEKPRIDGVSVNHPRASARAVDAMSPIAEMAYAIDNGRWRVGTSNDGIFDDSTEILPIELPKGLEPGVHTLAIRVADEAGNIGATTVTFRVGK